jgi:hypothetical protein
MNRGGYTLVELMTTLWLLGVVLDIGLNVNAALMRTARTPGQPTMLVDLACDSLRRDLTGKTYISGDELIAGKAHWRLVAGCLTRNGVQRCHASADWSITGHQVVVRVWPKGAQMREVSSWQ